MSVPGMYLCKFLILTVMLFVAVTLENLALMKIGMSDLPQETFEMGTLLCHHIHAGIVLYGADFLPL